VILILEDDQSIRETLGLVLDSLGYAHIEVSNAQDAIEVMRTHDPIVLIADLILSEGTASEAIAFCKATHQACRTILLTAAQRKMAEEAAKELQVDHLIMKPFNIEELQQLLK
jgi:CheY-like chemotaxis protein